MSTYQYTAVKITDKSQVQGTIHAESERHARELLREQELYPTLIKRIKAADPTIDKKRLKGKAHPLQDWLVEKVSNIGLQEKITFTQNLEMMVKAGIPITEALLYMESYMDNPKFKRMVNSIRMDILSGYSFSRALAKHKDVFNEVYVSIIQAGESSGELEVLLKRLSDILLGEARLRKKIISALTYPAIVVCIVFVVLLIMFMFVIPTFTDMYSKMGIQLPLITQIMVWISSFLRNYWYIALPLFGGMLYGLYRYSRTPSGKEFVDRSLLKIPVVSTLVNYVCCSHFISTLNVSFAAGLPITDCIYMACQTVTHTTLRRAFDTVNLKIQSGQHLATALADTEVLPTMTIIMISTGEKSGSLDEMLDHSLDYLEMEINQRVDILMSMMEPVLLVILGIIVGCMALSIYLPLFNMYEHIG
jgi:type IV pilus assembly protein PilC